MSLEVRNLTKHYGDKLVLDHLSFTMPGPGVYALLGTNGAGKTTAIRMMLGMLARDEGEALWNGQPLKPETCNVGYLAGPVSQVPAAGPAAVLCRPAGCGQSRRHGTHPLLVTAAGDG